MEPAVLKWIKTIGKRLPEPSVDSEIKEVEIVLLKQLKNSTKN